MVNTKTKYEVQGAGELHISDNANGRCGSAVGFNIGVSWGKHGLAGGVMDRAEAKQLADHIYAALNDPGLKTPEQIDASMFGKTA